MERVAFIRERDDALAILVVGQNFYKTAQLYDDDDERHYRHSHPLGLEWTEHIWNRIATDDVTIRIVGREGEGLYILHRDIMLCPRTGFVSTSSSIQTPDGIRIRLDKEDKEVKIALRGAEESIRLWETSRSRLTDLVVLSDPDARPAALVVYRDTSSQSAEVSLAINPYSPRLYLHDLYSKDESEVITDPHAIEIRHYREGVLTFLKGTAGKRSVHLLFSPFREVFTVMREADGWIIHTAPVLSRNTIAVLALWWVNDQKSPLRLRLHDVSGGFSEEVELKASWINEQVDPAEIKARISPDGAYVAVWRQVDELEVFANPIL